MCEVKWLCGGRGPRDRPCSTQDCQCSHSDRSYKACRRLWQPLERCFWARVWVHLPGSRVVDVATSCWGWEAQSVIQELYKRDIARDSHVNGRQALVLSQGSNHLLLKQASSYRSSLLVATKVTCPGGTSSRHDGRLVGGGAFPPHLVLGGSAESFPFPASGLAGAFRIQKHPTPEFSSETERVRPLAIRCVKTA